MSNYKQIKTNLTLLDYKKVEALAKTEGLSMSAYVRKLLNSKNDLDTQKENRAFTSCDPLLLYQLNKLGTNLNQLVKKVNITQSIDNEAFEKLELMAKSLDEIKKAHL